jgi:hypothetical protein
MQILLFGDLAALLTGIGTVLTAVWTWVAGAYTGIEAALEASILLQIIFGISAIFLVMSLVKKVVSVIKGFGKVK